MDTAGTDYIKDRITRFLNKCTDALNEQRNTLDPLFISKLIGSYRDSLLEIELLFRNTSYYKESAERVYLLLLVDKLSGSIIGFKYGSTKTLSTDPAFRERNYIHNFGQSDVLIIPCWTGVLLRDSESDTHKAGFEKLKILRSDECYGISKLYGVIEHSVESTITALDYQQREKYPSWANYKNVFKLIKYIQDHMKTNGHSFVSDNSLTSMTRVINERTNPVKKRKRTSSAKAILTREVNKLMSAEKTVRGVKEVNYKKQLDSASRMIRFMDRNPLDKRASKRVIARTLRDSQQTIEQETCA